MSEDVYVFPASSAQRRLWFVDQLTPASPLYNVVEVYELRGPVSVSSLERALAGIVERHEILRSSFADDRGEPEQVVHGRATVDLRLRDLREVPNGERLAEATALARDEARRPFDLSRSPLLRPLLVRLESERHLMLIATHHAVFDGWSSAVFWKELATLYEDALVDRASTLPELPLQFADFSEWQREWLQGPRSEELAAYWRRHLEGAAALELPSDRRRPAEPSDRGDEIGATIPPEVAEGLRVLARDEGATLFMALVAAVKTLLSRHSGEEDVSVGTAVAGRGQRGTDGLIGCFINQLVLRTDLSGDPSFRELLRRVRETTVGAFSHAELPFEHVVQELHPHRSLGASPFFGVMVVLQPGAEKALETKDSVVWSPVRLETHNGTAKFDLRFEFVEEDDGLACRVEYSTDLFDRETVERLLTRLDLLLRGIVADPDLPHTSLRLLTEAERRRLVVEWNDTAVDYPRDRCLHELFEAQAQQTPDAEAVLFERQSLSYRELNERANRLAHHLRALGIGPEVPVGICLERSPDLVIGLLAVLKAGGAYVPLDPDYPPERLGLILRDAGAPLLVTERTLASRLPSSLRAQAVWLDETREEIALRPSSNPETDVRPENLAYVIYTSGSTGRPKGVMIAHAGLVNYLAWCVGAYDVKAGTGAPVHSSISFDLTVTSLFPPLLTGRPVLLVPRDAGVEGLESALRGRPDYSLVKLTPAHLELLSRQLPSVEASGATRRFVIGGESLAAETLSFWREHAPETVLVNEYGPTETVVGCCVYEVSSRTPTSGPVPIGRAIANMSAYVLDPNRQPVPVGVAGELFIGGVGVGRGYLGQPELTAERFLPDPFSREEGARMYRTGDRARWRGDGNLVYLGRFDDQLKIRGYRIEPGEIEATLNRHPAVKESVVVAREDSPGDRRLIGWIVPVESAPPEPNGLRAHMKRTLPEHMVPATFVTLDRMPLTPNGKVDRKALETRELALPGLAKDHAPPATALEELVSRVWSDVIGVERISRYDDFFELGGHSLLATQVVSRVREALAVDLPLRWLFEAPTVRGLAERIGERANEDVLTRAELWLRLSRLSEHEVRRMLAE